MNTVIKIGDVIKHGDSIGIVFEIVGEPWSKYAPNAGSLKVLASSQDGIPSKMEFSTGARYYSFTIGNYPDEMERVEIIGHVDPETLNPYMKIRQDEAQHDKILIVPNHSIRRTHFKGRGNTERPTCPLCGEDLKRSYEYGLNEKTEKRQYIAYGWHCQNCHVEQWD